MEILTLNIKGNLRRYKEQVRAERMRYWLMIEVTVLIVAAALAVLAFIPKPWVLDNFIPFIILVPMFFLVSLMRFFNNTLNRPLQIALLLMIFVLLGIAAGFLKPTSPEVPSWIALALPLVTWPMLARLIIEVPHQSRMLSLRPKFGHLITLTAALFGLTIAAHKFLLGAFVPWISSPKVDLSFQTLSWMVGVCAGLIVPAEEILFRGAAFSVYHDDLERSYFATAFRITLLNFVLYLGLFVFNLHGATELYSGLLALFYKALLSFAGCFIVYRWRNLYASAAANLIFLIFAGQVFFL